MPEIYKTADGREYEAVIGMEIHAELNTDSKMYCRCRSAFGDPPNSHVCPVCLALPGSLPVVNYKAVILGIRTALALHCEFPASRFAQFARKHYFYPDLPKNYQITMYTYPLAVDGHLDIRSGNAPRTIGIERAHLEEDTAKLFHESDGTSSIDFNRAGIPLLEVVSKPELRSPEEAKLYLKELRDILRRNDISDGNMEEGSFRCEANISLKEKGTEQFGVKSEIKNLNSFIAVEKALHYEIKRHLDLYSKGEPIRPETRGWDDAKGETFHMRFKEKADEYRYFPEPDLPDLNITEQMLREAGRSLYPSPFEDKKYLMDEYGLDFKNADLLVSREGGKDLFIGTVYAGSAPDITVNWITGGLYAYLNKKGIEIKDCMLTTPNFIQLLKLLSDEIITGQVAKQLLEEICETGEQVDTIVKTRGLVQMSDDADLEPIVKKAIEDNPDMVASFKAGKEKAAKALIGKVMKITGGKANPQRVGELVRKFLTEE